MSKITSLTTKCILQCLDTDQLEELRHELNKNYVNVTFYNPNRKSKIIIKTIYVPGDLTELNIRLYFASLNDFFLRCNLYSYKINGMISDFEAQRLIKQYNLGTQFQIEEDSNCNAETFIQENTDLVIKALRFHLNKRIFDYTFNYWKLSK